jgi:hypothetical protein
LTTRRTDNPQLPSPGSPVHREPGFPVFSSVHTFAQSSYTRWSLSLSNNAAQLTATRAYHAIPASDDGSSPADYDESTFGYDPPGRQNKASDIEAARMSPTGIVV